MIDAEGYTFIANDSLLTLSLVNRRLNDRNTALSTVSSAAAEPNGVENEELASPNRLAAYCL